MTTVAINASPSSIPPGGSSTSHLGHDQCGERNSERRVGGGQWVAGCVANDDHNLYFGGHQLCWHIRLCADGSDSGFKRFPNSWYQCEPTFDHLWRKFHTYLDVYQRGKCDSERRIGGCQWIADCLADCNHYL